MNKREFNKLPEHEQDAELRRAAGKVNSALNLSGKETIAELIDAVFEDDGAAARMIECLLTPSLPDFPAHYCDAARPAANYFLRIARYYRQALRRAAERTQ